SPPARSVTWRTGLAASGRLSEAATVLAEEESVGKRGTPISPPARSVTWRTGLAASGRLSEAATVLAEEESVG
ncbi:hypothetical protein CTI14_71090, partial [Methylobacterium radiotolerans]